MSIQEVDFLFQRQRGLEGRRKQASKVFEKEIARADKAQQYLTRNLLDTLRVDKDDYVDDPVVWDLVTTAQEENVDPADFVRGFMSAVTVVKYPDLTGEDVSVDEEEDPTRLRRFGLKHIGQIGGSVNSNLCRRIANDAFRKAIGILEEQYGDRPTPLVKTELELTRYIQKNAGYLANISEQYFWDNY